MKALALLGLLTLLTGCKYKTLDQIIDAGNIQVVTVGSGSEVCLEKQISQINSG